LQQRPHHHQQRLRRLQEGCSTCSLLHLQGWAAPPPAWKAALLAAALAGPLRPPPGSLRPGLTSR
jgi:hypothetical protein